MNKKVAVENLMTFGLCLAFFVQACANKTSSSTDASTSSGGTSGGGTDSGGGGTGGGGTGGGSTPTYGMDCLSTNFSFASAYAIAQTGSINPISYVTSISGSTITSVSLPIYLATGVSQIYTYSASMTLNVYGCVTPNTTLSGLTALATNSTPTYTGQSGGFSLGSAGAGSNGEPTVFDFSSSPITIPTNCTAGQYVLALEVANVSTASGTVYMAETSGSTSCFLMVSPSATQASTSAGNSFEAIITATP